MIQSPLYYQTKTSGRVDDPKEHIIKKSLIFGFKIFIFYLPYLTKFKMLLFLHLNISEIRINIITGSTFY